MEEEVPEPEHEEEEQNSDPGSAKDAVVVTDSRTGEKSFGDVLSPKAAAEEASRKGPLDLPVDVNPVKIDPSRKN